MQAKNDKVWGLEFLKQRVSQLRHKLYELGLTSREFVNIMKTIFCKVCGKSYPMRIHSEKDVAKMLVAYLHNKKNNKAIVIELITEVDLRYGALEINEDKEPEATPPKKI